MKMSVARWDQQRVAQRETNTIDCSLVGESQFVVRDGKMVRLTMNIVLKDGRFVDCREIAPGEDVQQRSLATCTITTAASIVSKMSLCDFADLVSLCHESSRAET